MNVTVARSLPVTPLKTNKQEKDSKGNADGRITLKMGEKKETS